MPTDLRRYVISVLLANMISKLQGDEVLLREFLGLGVTGYEYCSDEQLICEYYDEIVV